MNDNEGNETNETKIEADDDIVEVGDARVAQMCAICSRAHVPGTYFDALTLRAMPREFGELSVTASPLCRRCLIGAGKNFAGAVQSVAREARVPIRALFDDAPADTAAFVAAGGNIVAAARKLLSARGRAIFDEWVASIDEGGEQ